VCSITSNYCRNAAQLVVLKRFSSGLNFKRLVHHFEADRPDRFRQSRERDAGAGDRGLGHSAKPADQFLYELPFGAGKPLGSDLPKPLRWLASGREMSTLTRLQEGMPMSFPSGATQNCAAGEQPAWTIRQPDTLQNWSTRLSSVRLPGIHNVDISAMRRSRLTERFTLLFRTDFINGFNSPPFFSGPITSVTSPNFGRISGAMDQSNLPRFIQFSMKLVF
jgi:hypothetical protein